MDSLSYEAAGVNIDAADAMKRQLARDVSSRSFSHCAPINRVGAFASLVEIDLAQYKHPVFVLKSEEPGSKQMLSIDNDRIEWIAQDLINHLVNDIIVMGATPCAVLDTIICGKLEGEKVRRLVRAMSEACSENGCTLVGGETSEQPGALPEGRYILQASILGIVDRERIIDGAAIRSGDAIVALASNGLHTNGYSLVRKLIDTKPAILDEKIGERSFMDAILAPHMSYAAAVRELIRRYGDYVHGMAHITGGGMRDNLVRILHDNDGNEGNEGNEGSKGGKSGEGGDGGDTTLAPAGQHPCSAGGLRAVIDLSAIRVHDIFKIIKEYANTSDNDMLRTFNNGVGMLLVVDAQKADAIVQLMQDAGVDAYVTGQIESGTRDVVFRNAIIW